MFCDLVFHCFSGKSWFTHAIRCAKTIDFACVLVYLPEFTNSLFREIRVFVTNFLTVFGGEIVVWQIVFRRMTLQTHSYLGWWWSWWW